MRKLQRVALVSGVALAAGRCRTAVAAEASVSAAPSAPYSAIVVNGTEAGGSFVRDLSTNSFTMLGEPHGWCSSRAPAPGSTQPPS